MMEEDADHPALSRLSFVEEIRRNALDRFLQVQKLRFSVGGSRTFGASKLVHRRAADLTVDDLGIVLHRELEGHPTGVVTYYSAPLERHRKSLLPDLTKMQPFAGLAEGPHVCLAIHMLKPDWCLTRQMRATTRLVTETMIASEGAVMLFPEKKAPTRWTQRPQIFPNDDDERLASAILTQKPIPSFSFLISIELMGGTLDWKGRTNAARVHSRLCPRRERETHNRRWS